MGGTDLKPLERRADSSKLWEIFQKYSSIKPTTTNLNGPNGVQNGHLSGEYLMTYDDFVCGFLGLFPQENPNPDTIRMLGSIADTNKDGLISFSEFQSFESLLCSADALFAAAFQMFDANGSGFVSFDAFRRVMEKSTVLENIPFNFDSEFIDMRFGKDRKRQIRYSEFTQLLRELHEERARQAFVHMDRDHDGLIGAREFQQILALLRGHLLTPFVRAHLLDIVNANASAPEKGPAQRVSYAYLSAFLSLLAHMQLVSNTYLGLTNGFHALPVSRDQLLLESQKYTQLTPMEIEILFQMAALERSDGCITYKEIEKIAPLHEGRMVYTQHAQLPRSAEAKAGNPVRQTALLRVGESIYRFTLGGIAGAIGATAVYPIDLVKTRMQNQRVSQAVESRMYKHSFDCFLKVLRFEGVLGLYRGLVPQLVGVAPEKAIKLTVNDLLKDLTTDAHGHIPLGAEVLAGGCAGGSQVIFTNPLEIVKIRLQVAGEVAGGQRPSALRVARGLGFLGLYKGSSACFLRDIPFSAIYFPVYHHNKLYFADEHGYNSPISLFVAGTLAGVPAAFLPTPADVVKTRLQVQARTGQSTYKGLSDAFRKIYHEEGMRAFWKGSLARVFRSSPQFGVTLMSYEILQRAFSDLGVDFGGRKPSGMHKRKPVAHISKALNPDHVGGYRLALATFEGIENRFGLSFPKFAPITRVL